ncbi:MAG: hypothetical protein M3Q52_03440 [Pseudomonadota bacterium]|nr:hypothetical protein [Pseudomonadota bacterium]
MRKVWFSMLLAGAACLSATAACTTVAAGPPIIQVPANGSWGTLPTAPYKGKRDDIHFANARTGFYGTGAGDLFRSDDGGATWSKIWSKPGTFIRAVGFIDADHGFIGNVGDYYPNVTDRTPLYRTRDGGRSWSPVDLGGAVLEGICAIDVLLTRSIYQGELRRRAVIHAAGRVGGPAKLLRSVDGGESWNFIDLSDHAGMILDVKFVDAETGFVFAGSDKDIQQSEALILKTSDGGKSWREVYRSGRKLENSWKGSFVDGRTGYATVQTYDPQRAQQVVVKTVDGGEHWAEVPLVVDAKARQFGIGFASPAIGWVGTAAGGFETRDGGASWTKVPLAPATNKIRTRAADGTPMIYAIGTQVQVYGPAVVPSPSE